MMLRSGCLAAACVFLAAPAQAAVDWCHLAAQAPTYDHGFDDIVAGLDASGCSKLQIASAHLRTWTCSAEKPDDVTVHLVRFTEGRASGSTALIIGAEVMPTLDVFRACPGVQSTPSPFDRASIAVRDRLSVRTGYLPTNMTLLSMGPSGLAVMTSSSGNQALSVVERAMYGFDRPSYSTTSVEIAGQNLVSTSAVKLVGALVGRGAKILTDDGDYPVRSFTLSPPVGLEGVSEVAVATMGQLTSVVEYKIQGEQAYSTYVALLNDKYGASDVVTLTDREKKGCRLRSWESGVVDIFGEYCPSGAPRISFYNGVALDEGEAFSKFLKEAPGGKSKNIDPDNL